MDINILPADRNGNINIYIYNSGENPADISSKLYLTSSGFT